MILVAALRSLLKWNAQKAQPSSAAAVVISPETFLLQTGPPDWPLGPTKDVWLALAWIFFDWTMNVQSRDAWNGMYSSVNQDLSSIGWSRLPFLQSYYLFLVKNGYSFPLHLPAMSELIQFWKFPEAKNGFVLTVILCSAKLSSIRSGYRWENPSFSRHGRRARGREGKLLLAVEKSSATNIRINLRMGT